MYRRTFGIISFSTDSLMGNFDFRIEVLKILGENGAVVVDVIEDNRYVKPVIRYKVFWERFPETKYEMMIPEYKIMMMEKRSRFRTYRRTYEIKVGEEIIPLGSVVVSNITLGGELL